MVLDDGWVRVQVYLPEVFRYKMRMAMPNYQSDSRRARDLLICILTKFSEDDICDCLSYSESTGLTDDNEI